ncbi:MAG: fructosamine kinase family protein [Betaproteobacteria bacterium]|nr:fructosamine kinase family protein [Betaproteobacteria bacterium]
MDPWQDIERSIREASGAPFAIESSGAVGGGCINQGYRVRGKDAAYFVKVNEPTRLPMFEAEAAGLAELARSSTVRVPRPVCHGANARASWIALEWIEFGRAGSAGMRELGRGLARLHRVSGERYGWHRDNTIGATQQINTPGADWVAFWREHRLGYQLKLAAGNGHRGRLQDDGARLLDRLPAFFEGYRPAPSLLHGDLWSGNAGFDANGAPVIYDPAVYYGDREADLAMTGLFGGFSPDFYSGYREEFPLDPGYARRKDLYNLYHVLNHLNLFGGGYRAQAERMITQLLASV